MSQTKRVGPVTVIVEPSRKKEGSRPSQSAVYRNISGADGELVTKFNGLTTPFEVFADSVHRFPDRECLGWRPIASDGTAGDYKYYSYKETDELAAHVASGFHKLGVGPQSKVGVWSVNCVEWMLSIRGAERNSGVIVPMYDSLGETAIEYITRHSELEIAVVQKDKMESMAAVCEKDISTLRGCICIGEIDPAVKERVEKCGLFIHTFEELVELGRRSPSKATPPAPEDVCCVMYTSGTSGTPKGVVIHHRAVVSGIASAHDMIAQTKLGISENDSLLSYMPLAHIFDRLLEEFALSVGARIGYWQGNVKKLMDDVAAFKPSLFMAVPRILERVCDGVETKLAKGSPIIRGLFNCAFVVKRKMLNMGISHEVSGLLTDSTVFAKLKSALGGHVRFIVSGGAPLPAHVEEFCTVCLAPVLQGYGLTESCAASFIMLPDPRMSKTVGPPLKSTEFRLESVPDLEYDALADPPKGEILLRGPMLFSGYFKDPEKTKDAIDSDGWFHTGDVGTITEQGCLKIIDRVKNLFKLSQGEYVAVEYIEGVYSRCPSVEQIWVYGDSEHSFLVAVAVPKASAKGISESDLLKELIHTGKDAKLKGFEMIKALTISEEEFSVDNDLLTPTFKPKRPQLKKRYMQDLERMYQTVKF
jgi:long-chain acyl-CoA synthetase